MGRKGLERSSGDRLRYFGPQPNLTDTAKFAVKCGAVATVTRLRAGAHAILSRASRTGKQMRVIRTISADEVAVRRPRATKATAKYGDFLSARAPASTYARTLLMPYGLTTSISFRTF
jgi:hypothetical protein